MTQQAGPQGQEGPQDKKAENSDRNRPVLKQAIKTVMVGKAHETGAQILLEGNAGNCAVDQRRQSQQRHEESLGIFPPDQKTQESQKADMDSVICSREYRVILSAEEDPWKKRRSRYDEIRNGCAAGDGHSRRRE